MEVTKFQKSYKLPFGYALFINKRCVTNKATDYIKKSIYINIDKAQ